MEIDAIEINKKIINKLKKFFYNDRINFINQDVFTFKYRKTDLVVCFEFLEHTHKHEDLFKIISSISDSFLLAPQMKILDRDKRAYKSLSCKTLETRRIRK